MPKILVSYRQENAAHGQQVRALAERLRARLAPLGLEIVLDQFLLDQKPGGPTEGWPMWSAAQVREAARVVMVVSPGWADCFNGKVSLGVGAGVACEARVIFQELYDAHGKSDKHRVCLLDRTHADCIPTGLAGYHRFLSPDDDDGLCAWLQQIVPSATSAAATPPALAWPAARTDFKHRLADRTEVFGCFQRMLAGQSGDQRILLVRAATNHGKSALVATFTEYAQNLLPWALVDLKGCPGTAEVLAELNSELKQRLRGWVKANTLGEALVRLEETSQTQPVLLIFDTYEQGAEEFRKTLEGPWLGSVRRTEGLRFIISGQKVPADWEKNPWAKWVQAVELTALDKLEDWEPWARERHPALTRQHIEALVGGLKGVPGSVAAALDAFGAALGKRPAA
jgi:hypothetical protein